MLVANPSWAGENALVHALRGVAAAVPPAATGSWTPAAKPLAPDSSGSDGATPVLPSDGKRVPGRSLNVRIRSVPKRIVYKRTSPAWVGSSNVHYEAEKSRLFVRGCAPPLKLAWIGAADLAQQD